MMKRFFLLLLAVAAITATASAQNTTVIDSGTSGSLTWELTADSTLTISGEGAMLDYNSSDSIPWSDHKHVIKKVIIQEGITSIGNGAFYGCEALKDITIPKRVRSIEDKAFAGTALIDVTLPRGVKRIGEWTFAACTKLKSITLPESLTHVENYAFWNCTSLISVTCLATTPPPLGRHYNFEFNSSDTLYVPAGSVEAYRKSGWSKAFTTITAIP